MQGQNPHAGAIQNSSTFKTTHWGMVAAAGGQTTAESRSALSELCQQYWFPLFAYIRRAGYRVNEAEDLTQAFFAMLLEKKAIRYADRTRGRFRSYLLGALKNFLINETERAHALKRGGGKPVISLDAAAGEGRLSLEPADHQSPDRFFDRQWALTVLQHSLAMLKKELERQGKEKFFEKTQSCLTGAEKESDYQKIGTELGMTAGAVKVAVHRMRRRYRDLLRLQIMQTLHSPEEVEDEIQYLFEALRA